ncbi:MAG: Ycf66 family protein [Cyanobacteria bacterium P01_G01_bin.38]
MNFGTPVPLLLGVILIFGAIGLFFLDRLKPGYERDSDKVYAVLSLFAGVLLLGSLDMGPIPAFQQIIMVGMFITLMIQNLLSRSPREERLTPQASYEGPPARPGYSSRSSRPSRKSGGRRNIRAELDRDSGFPPDYRSSSPRPMLEGREERSYREYADTSRGRYDEPEQRPMGRSNPSQKARPPYYDDRLDERSWSDERRLRDRSPDYADKARVPRRPPLDEGSSGRRDRSDRTLNVRPYSERPVANQRPDAPNEEGGYVNYRPVDKSSGAPVDEPQDYGDNY